MLLVSVGGCVDVMYCLLWFWLLCVVLLYLVLFWVCVMVGGYRVFLVLFCWVGCCCCCVGVGVWLWV